MKIQRSLPRLASWMLRHLKNRGAYLGQLRTLGGPLTAKDFGFLVVDTHNLLHHFMRNYCLASLTGAYTAAGSKVTNQKSIQGYEAALTFAVTTMRQSLIGKGPPWNFSDEPPWHDPTVIIKVLHAASCSNAMQVSYILSPQPTAISHWTRARHFLAHRSARTAVRVRELGVHYDLGLPKDPVTVMAALNTNGHRMIVEDWFEEVAQIVGSLPK